MSYVNISRALNESTSSSFYGPSPLEKIVRMAVVDKLLDEAITEESNTATATQDYHFEVDGINFDSNPLLGLAYIKAKLICIGARK